MGDSVVDGEGDVADSVWPLGTRRSRPASGAEDPCLWRSGWGTCRLLIVKDDGRHGGSKMGGGVPEDGGRGDLAIVSALAMVTLMVASLQARPDIRSGRDRVVPSQWPDGDQIATLRH